MSDSWAEFIGSGADDFSIDVTSTANEPAGPPPVDVAELASKLLLDSEEWLQEAFDLLEDRKQLVLYGPPGTGKTYLARAVARFLTGEDVEPKVVQFHPSYTYEQFVEGYRPVLNDEGSMVYRLMPGPLVEFAELARMNEERKFILLIDEINRGNLSKIFGELLYLLEYRDDTVRLMYREADSPPFSLPPNLYVLGTMNTADRSIGTIDAALRRRFHFLGLFPNRNPILETLTKWIGGNAPALSWLPSVVSRLNQRLATIDNQIQVGHSFFMRPGIDEARVNLIWKADILPYLEDQLFGREDVEEAWSLSQIRLELEQEKSGAVDEIDLGQGA